MALPNREVLYKVARILGGEEAVSIVKILENVDEITDEEIVAKTKIKLNTVRKILYRLYNHSIVGLRRTSHQFYYCGTPGHRRIPFEEATEYIFRCPECDKPLMYYDNSKIIEFLTRKIEQLRAELQ